MQTEKSQPWGQRIMPETRFTEYPALSVDPRVWISLSASKTDHRFYLSFLFLCMFLLVRISAAATSEKVVIGDSFEITYI